MLISKQYSLSLKHSLNYYFFGFIILHSILWTVGPALLRTSVTHDTLEGITWGLQWQLGYNKHPFLTAWLCAAVLQLFGVVGWPLYLLAQGAVFVTFYATWRLALQMLPALYALVATLALEGVLFYNINSFNITPDTLQSPLWALLILFFYKALKGQKLMDWLAVGLFAGLSLCAKYQVALLLLTMLLFCILNSKARESFKKPGLYCAIGVFLALITPHLVWLYQHDFITVLYAIQSSAEYTTNTGLLNHVLYPLKFLINNTLNTAGLFLLFWPFYTAHKITKEPDAFEWKFLIYMGLGPLVLTLLLCLISGTNFTARWSTPYFSTLGILAIGCIKPKFTRKNVKQFAFTLISLSLILFLVRMTSFAKHSRPASDAFLPNEQIALQLSKIWHDRYQQDLPFIAGSNYLVASVMPYMLDKPIPYLSWKKSASPWIKEQDIRRQGALFIWDAGCNYRWDANSNVCTIPQRVMDNFPKLRFLPNQIFYRISDKKPVVVGVAILPPN